MSVAHEKRTGKDRRKHYVKLPRAFERRLKATPQRQVMAADKSSDAAQGVSEAYWGA